MSTQFADLLASLNKDVADAEALTKALPVEDGTDDKTIQAAATEGANGEEEEDEDEPTFGKSMQVVGENGEEETAIDATDLIKSLIERSDKQEASTTQVLEAVVTLAKSQNATIKQLTDMHKSLQADVKALSGQGRGRRTVVVGSGDPSAAPLVKALGEPAQITPAEVLAKSHAAFDAGKITGLELTTIDVSLRSRQSIDAGLLARIAQA